MIIEAIGPSRMLFSSERLRQSPMKTVSSFAPGV
jgi:hypothetical protein